jgi:bifunctional UDP-N-acetylglucosamine pyrophosphorylase/glucosamine-1-phosphate N-acetyltransferase
VRAALPQLGSFSGTVLILYGDAPLIKFTTVETLLKLHSERQATLSLVTLITHAPNAYGRIVRDSKSGQILRIVELKDCTESEACISEFNPGIYAVESGFLAPALSNLKNNNAQHEYYLTDIVAEAVKAGKLIVSHPSFDAREMQGVNDWYELQAVNNTLRARRVDELLRSGVKIMDPASLFVDLGVQVAPGVVLGPNVQLLGKTVLEAGVLVDGSALLKDTVAQSGAHIKFCVQSEGAVIGKDAAVGPFAHLRAGTVLGQEVKVGNFVETKKAVLERGVKASHLSYLGDCTVGEETNIGAGTITCNYDGHKKHQTTIGKEVFIGSNSALVAPVKIEDGAMVGAGSVITKDVEQDSLAVARAQQVSKPGWAKARRTRQSKN